MCRGDRQNHVIERGDTYLAIKDGLNDKIYCLACARVILERGHTKLRRLFEALENAEG